MALNLTAARSEVEVEEEIMVVGACDELLIGVFTEKLCKRERRHEVKIPGSNGDELNAERSIGASMDGRGEASGEVSAKI